MRRHSLLLLILSLILLAPTRAWEASVSKNTSITITTAAISFNPTSLSFASQTVGSSSAAQTVTVTNSGSVSFQLSSIGIAGTNAGAFAESNDCPSPIAISASCTVSVTFTPTATGTQTASLAVYAAGGGTFTAGLSGTGAAAGGTTSGPTPSSFFGMHIDAAADWPGSPTIVSARGKCSGTTWPYLESSPGVYDWSNLDYCLSTAQSHGASLFVANDCTNSSLCSGGAAPNGLGIPSWSSCANLATDYGNFFKALVTRYGTSLTYELWNEPGSVGCTSAQLTAAINAAHDAVRSIAPGALILAPSWVGPQSYLQSQIQSFYANGGTQDVDAWTVHSYPSTPEGFLSDLASYQAVYAAYPTVAAKPVWMTEGAAYGPTLPSASVMAADIARYYLLNWAEGMVRAYWYEWDAWGTIMGSTTAVTAYNQVQNWLIGASSPALVTSTAPVYTVTMTQSGGSSAQAVWNTSGSSSYSVPAGYGHYKDLAGNTNSISGGTVTIGTQPILLVP